MLALLTVPSIVVLVLSARASAQCDVRGEVLSGSPAIGAGFGLQVAQQGDVAVVGAPQENGYRGTTTLFLRDALGVWQRFGNLPATDLQDYDFFGEALALDGDTVFVGAPHHDQRAANSGAVYVFQRDHLGPDQWGERGHFAPPSAGTNARFGQALARAGDLLLVGAPSNSLSTSSGRAYLYRRDASHPFGWSFVRELTDSRPGSSFGSSVAIGADFVAVRNGVTTGFGYMVHVYERDAGGPDQWGEVRQILPAPRRWFFSNVAADGDRIALIAEDHRDLWYDVEVYRRDAGGPGAWGRERATSFPTQGFNRPDRVALRGDWLVASQPYYEVDFHPAAGTVFVFHRDVGGPAAWGPVASLVGSPPVVDASLGSALCVDGDDLFAGAPALVNNPGIGTAHFFHLDALAIATWRNDAAGSNPDVYRAGIPLLGGIFEAEVDLRPSGHASLEPGLAELLLMRAPVELPLASGVLLGRGFLDRVAVPGPIATFGFGLPVDAALCGVRLTTQVRMTGSSLPPALTNAFDLRLGS